MKLDEVTGYLEITTEEMKIAVDKQFSPSPEYDNHIFRHDSLVTFTKIKIQSCYLFSDTEKYIRFEQCIFEDSLVIGMPNAQVRLKDCTMDTLELRTKGKSLANTAVIDCIIQHVRIDCNSFTRTKLLFQTSYLRHIFLEGSLSDQAVLKFEGTTHLYIYFTNFSNQGTFALSRITFNKDSSIKLDNAQFGTAHFHNIDFTETYFEVGDVDMVNITFSTIRWPRNAYINQLADHLYSKQRRRHVAIEFFRQLKVLGADKRDIVMEHYYHASEMRMRLKEARLFKKPSLTLVLLFSRWTSNFGQSLSLPILTILCFNGCIYTYLIANYTIDGFTQLNFSNSSDYWNMLAEFVRHSNPLHEDKPTLRGIPFLLDLLMRIISSYSIYNFIRATRRFVK